MMMGDKYFSNETKFVWKKSNEIDLFNAKICTVPGFFWSLHPCRILWALVFSFGLAASSYFCWLMWQKWDESPILMSLDTSVDLPPTVSYRSTNKLMDVSIDQRNSPHAHPCQNFKI